MDRLTSTLRVALGVVVLGLAGMGSAQTGGAGQPAGTGQTGVPAKTGQAAGQTAAPAAASPSPRLQLQTLDPGARPDPFPPVNRKFFTADSPTAATVDSYLHAMLGYDPDRIWRVEAIQKTASPGVSKVVALVSERTAGAKIQSAAFIVLPDGKHLVADATVQPFGADPFADNRALLKARADGPSHGAVAKELMLVEFADLQCPHCKDAQAIMTRLAQDFPKARIVYESYPLVEIHPQAYQAAAYGACIAHSNTAAFFTFAQAVYDTQAALTQDGDQTLKDAVQKAGLNPDTIAACSTTDVAKTAVDASTRLATDLGIDATPTLAVNGRILPLTTIPYETLKNLIVFQAGLDGVGNLATPLTVGVGPQ